MNLSEITATTKKGNICRPLKMAKNMEHKATHLDVFDLVCLWATNQCIKTKIMTDTEENQ